VLIKKHWTRFACIESLKGLEWQGGSIRDSAPYEVNLRTTTWGHDKSLPTLTSRAVLLAS